MTITLRDKLIRAILVITLCLGLYFSLFYIADLLNYFIVTLTNTTYDLRMLTFTCAYGINLSLMYFFIMPRIKLKFNLPLKGNSIDGLYIVISLFIILIIINHFIAHFIRNLLDYNGNLIQSEMGGEVNFILGLFGLLAAGILIPISEELLFRGFLYKGLRTKLGIIISSIICSIIFAGIHLHDYHSNEAKIILFSIIFLISLILCFSYEKTNNLWGPITIHVVNNVIAIPVQFLYLM